MPVSLMLDSMPASEYRDWQAYFSIVPFTQEREDQRTGTIAATIVNMTPGIKGRDATIADFIPKWRRVTQKAATPEVIAGKVALLRAMFTQKVEN